MKKLLLISGLIVLITGGIMWFHEFDQPASGYSGSPPNGSRLSDLLSDADMAGYSLATQTREFRFPEDHGPHPDFRNEWWYLTGNLEDRKGRRFGFELTFFRFALTPRLQTDSGGRSGSRWRSRQVYIAHFAVTDSKSEQFYVEQRASRGALGLAGSQTRPFRVWIEDWSISEKQTGGTAGNAGEHWQLKAPGEQIALDLELSAEKAPVLNGVGGLSQKSAKQGNASFYYSISRMRSEGRLQIAGETFEVSGLSWLDREWSSSALADDQQGWDWFALQLSDGSDLMFYSIRKTDGTQDEHSAGTWIARDGKVRHLGRDDVNITVTDKWVSPEGGTYPSGWDIRSPPLDLALSVTPLISNQELFTTVRYWEGAVEVKGRRRGAPVNGYGYVELTGYAR